MKTIPGSMVRLNVPEWYEEPEFQAWFNLQLGKGLATWQSAHQKLQECRLLPEECASLARKLRESVINVHLFFEPVYVGDQDFLNDELCRVETAMLCLERVDDELTAAANGEGLRGEVIKELAESLLSDVISADVYHEPKMIQGYESYRAETRAILMAKSTLEQIAMRLQSVGERAVMQDGYAYADCFVGVDPSFNGEGTDSDMPEKYWDIVVEEARKACVGSPDVHVIVWLSPVN